MKLLISFENEKLKEYVASAFEGKHYLVDTCSSYHEAKIHIALKEYDAMLMQCECSGKTVIEYITDFRQSGATIPVVYLSDCKDIVYKVDVFEAGADEFICIPFSVHELMARVKSVLRRKKDYIADVIVYHGLSLNCSLRQLAYQDRHISLTFIEFQILEKMMRSPERIITLDYLTGYVWGWDEKVGSGVVWTHISNIRKKIKILEAEVEIRTYKSVGYVLIKKQLKDEVLL